MTIQGEAKIVLRWEWRTFDASLKAIEGRIAAALEQVAPHTSAEIYLLRLGGPQNVKIRDGILDVKRLQQVDVNGLELWEPVLKAKFPLSQNDVATAFLEWQLSLPGLGRNTYTIDQFTNQLIAAHPHLRVAPVTKSRRRFPLTRTVRDAARILTEIAGPDAKGGSASINYEHEIDGSLAGIRMGVAEGYFDEDLDPDVHKVVTGSLEVLRQSGANIIPVKIPRSVSIASDLHPLVMKAEGSANHKPWKRTRGDEYSAEVGKRLEAGFFIPASDYINALQFRVFALDDFLETVLSKVDVLHTPLLPIPTPTLEQTAYSDGPNYLKMVVALTRNTKVINFLGLPALSVTCGYTSDGMPTSFQLVGRPFSESLLLRLGHRYQMESKLYHDIPRELRRTSTQASVAAQ